jgi:hypothetical protein
VLCCALDPCCLQVGDFKTAATMYQSCGQYAKAFAIFGEHGMLTELMEVIVPHRSPSWTP